MVDSTHVQQKPVLVTKERSSLEQASRGPVADHSVHHNRRIVTKKQPPAKRILFKPISQLPLSWTGALITIVLFALTVSYAMTAHLGKPAPWLQSSQSHTILLLRILSEATSIGLAMLIGSALERLQWMLISRSRGLSFPILLSLESRTGVQGLLKLLFLHGFALRTRLSSLMRLFLQLVVPVLSVLIMSTASRTLLF